MSTMAKPLSSPASIGNHNPVNIFNKGEIERKIQKERIIIVSQA
jgi:hypothetical protein